MTLAAPAFAAAEGAAVLDQAAALERSGAAIGRLVGDHRFTDVDGRVLGLAGLRGRPLLINLVYTACSESCPLVIQNLSHAVDVAQEALGEDSFSVVTIGFDARQDTPARMYDFARSQGIDLPNWRFLSGSRATIDALAEEVGFTFYPSAKGFDHLTQTTVVDAEGRVYWQVYGANFEAPSIVEPLKDLVFGRRAGFDTIAGLVNRIKLFCTIYNPNSARYHFDYSVFIGAAIGLMSLTGIGFIGVRSWLRDRRESRRA